MCNLRGGDILQSVQGRARLARLQERTRELLLQLQFVLLFHPGEASAPLRADAPARRHFMFKV